MDSGHPHQLQRWDPALEWPIAIQAIGTRHPPKNILLALHDKSADIKILHHGRCFDETIVDEQTTQRLAAMQEESLARPSSGDAETCL